MMKMLKNTTRIFSLILLLMLMALSMSSVGFGSSVAYEGESQSFIFLPGSESSPTDLFENLKSVMPGDVLTDQITVNNDAANDMKVKLYIRAVGAKGDEEFLSKLNLRVEQDGETILFDAPPSDAAQLKDWVYLGTFYPGESSVLDLTLEAPIELDDSFQKAVGSVEWEFKAEELPADDMQTDEKDSELSKTGDGLHMGLWLPLGMAAMIAFLFTGARRRSL